MLVMLLFSFLLQCAGFACMILGLLWNRRRGRTDRSERALALKAPISSERSRVSLFLRHGGSAPDPELAHLTVRVATDLRRRLENPWPFTGAGLFLLGSALTMAIRSFQSGYPGLLWLGLGFAGIALVVCFLPYRQAMLDRADRALAANRELAAQYEVPQEEPPPPPRER